MESGFIKVFRSVRHQWTWLDRPFNAASAWIDLLLRASWRRVDIAYMKRIIRMSRGQLACTERELHRSWGWSRGRVKTFLRQLHESAMITTTNGPGYIVITICNYHTYQAGPSQSGHKKATLDTTKKPSTLPGPGRDRATNKKIKKVKKKEGAASSPSDTAALKNPKDMSATEARHVRQFNKILRTPFSPEIDQGLRMAEERA